MIRVSKLFFISSLSTSWPFWKIRETRLTRSKGQKSATREMLVARLSPNFPPLKIRLWTSSMVIQYIQYIRCQDDFVIKRKIPKSQCQGHKGVRFEHYLNNNINYLCQYRADIFLFCVSALHHYCNTYWMCSKQTLCTLDFLRIKPQVTTQILFDLKSDVWSLFVYLFFMNQHFVPGLERHSSSSDGCDQSMVIWLRQQQAFLVTLVIPISETWSQRNSGIAFFSTLN